MQEQYIVRCLYHLPLLSFILPLLPPLLSCSKVDPGLVLRVIPLLSYMMDDPSINVIKRLLVCVLHVYKHAFIVSSWLVTLDSQCLLSIYT